MSDIEGGYVHWEQNLAAAATALERIATALERAAPAREDRRPQLAWWVGEVERLKDCVTRAERELDEARERQDRITETCQGQTLRASRLQRERDRLIADFVTVRYERDAARASAEKLREALEKYGNHVLPCTRRSIGPAADCTCGFEQAGAE